ncbi:MAG: dihydroorotate dehydrogenase electron transfer subunit [Bacteroidales bacterium]|jgi:dihydroorotate dehydrogenase electron transfer subunit|nr:dihydroorotate dehydrogenase electron transfer subunit [Bacteroidales bacterium]MDD2204309.1 dihydroorotate dehydrogenase electron transfer subunit [Bacteroidales bacterium]MDD3151361.1 dihydroorotate dehydrogenase electron transfer subunit [Bacteroidales bacterium]MDD3913190.1 dihydroorotate dehydrogenase electron transfer subunit [Bacteroidales bacterium]MDD4633105.1 dihydroorotate dehydrogenase electron transfer subunit [Bacteroidales bacterium]
MKSIRKLTIADKINVEDNYFILKCFSAEALPEMFPGQFASIKVENNPNVFLRRPFSIHDYCPETNEVSFLIKIVGKGTCSLSKLSVNQQIDVILPLGNGFNLNKSGKALIIGGGCGIAPIFFLAKKLKSMNADFDILIGGRSCHDLLCYKELSGLSHLYCTTEDGSEGTKGYVTNHNCLIDNNIDYKRIYCCGPENMLKAVAKHAKERDIFCEVSLENHMACGIGVCLCCVTETIHGNECVCSQGPVFNIKDLKW